MLARPCGWAADHARGAEGRAGGEHGRHTGSALTPAAMRIIASTVDLFRTRGDAADSHQAITCSACGHYQRVDGHPHPGRCGEGVQAPGDGGLWWAESRHMCARYIDTEGAREAAEKRAAILEHDGGLDRTEVESVATLAERFYSHIMGTGKATGCCHAQVGRYCPEGERL
jgi:hypothetical protein